jgi:hypothetical protein
LLNRALHHVEGTREHITDFTHRSALIRGFGLEREL